MKYLGEAPQEELATGERSTRNRVARSILDHGPSTVSDLAGRLGLTQAAVRRHLDALAADSVVEARDQRVYGSRGRGRPAKVFALTDCGRDAFDQSYDKLAAEALGWISTAAGGGERGEAAVAAFARARIAAQAEAGRYADVVEAAGPGGRTEALAKALSADGYAATARGAANQQGEQLCQHHCPVAHVAEQYPQLCEAETEFFSQLLGTHVQRLATIAHGDGVCTTFIPRATASPQTGGAPTGAPQAASPETTDQASESKAGRNPA
ncbi:ArsR family transcriptional regulator [Streptomyces sp. NBC_01317]|uniref:helix-turn-helix transcriptional regulator n=1 Tax=Streptomyces sp. NBC_01317 TaxID=2903822 RepID=UPI002E116FE3|nr:ArsR family transcriptional regulator [Streptomyces sp. NBC_01317]